jgi:arylsulfatase A-like enzyme
VVTADHGELFGERGLWGHGQALTQEELHVPLVVRYPGGERGGTRSDAPIQLLDVPVLLLDELRLELPPTTQGGRPHPVVAEVYPLEKFVPTGDWRVLVAWPHKYVWNSRMPEALFDLSEPDGETRNRALVEPELTARLRAQLESYLASLPPPPPAGPQTTIEGDLSEALHNLGYMDGADEE